MYLPVPHKHSKRHLSTRLYPIYTVLCLHDLQSNAPSSIFLYLVVLGVLGGISYFVYNTWITTFFPQKKGRGKGGERAKKSSLGSKKVDPADQVAVVGADGPAVTSGAKAYDESWIPASHLQRPEAKRVRSGTPKAKPRA
jgi:hypothetical protein